MTVALLVNENCLAPSVAILRPAGCNVFFIAESFAGIDDSQVNAVRYASAGDFLDAFSGMNRRLGYVPRTTAIARARIETIECLVPG